MLNRKRRLLEFQVGNKVMLKLSPQVWKQITVKRGHKGLIQPYEGPFKVLKKVGNVTYSQCLA